MIYIMVWALRKKRNQGSIKEKQEEQEAIQHSVTAKIYYFSVRTIIMPTYEIHVIIENKPSISDPEGDTILNDLILKGNNSSVKKIRAGKILKFTILAKNEKSAKKSVETICEDLRIFNPIVSKVTIESKTN
mgnify:FL=1